MANPEARALKGTTDGAQADHQHLLADVDYSNVNYEAANRSMAQNMELVYDGAKMVPTAFAAFAFPGTASANAVRGMSSYDAALATASKGTIGLGLAATFGTEFAMDRIFFGDQPIRGGTLLGDIAGTAAAIALPVPWTVKVPIMLAGHLGGKLIDKYAS